MKKIVLLMLLSLGLGLTLQAQSSDGEILRELFKMEKKEIVQEYMSLSGAKADAFWGLYEEYESARNVLQSSRLSVLKRYAEQYETLTGDQADALMKDVFANSKQDLSIKKKYFKKIEKSVGPKDAMAFWQLEEYLQTAIRFSILDAIPFVSKD